MTTRDPGLQPERTTLAWQRTALSAAVGALLLVRDGILRSEPLSLVAGVVLSALVVAIASRRTPGPPASPGLLALTTTATGAAGALFAAGLLLR